jgi:hypothetical protein
VKNKQIFHGNGSVKKQIFTVMGRWEAGGCAIDRQQKRARENVYTGAVIRERECVCVLGSWTQVCVCEREREVG